MTCIVAIAKDGVVYMGADSYGSNRYTGGIVHNSKCFITGEFLIGSCGSFRLIDLLTHKLSVPKVHPDEQVNSDKFIRTIFVDAVRNCLNSNGHLTKKDGNDIGGNFLVGYKGNVYEVQQDFSVLNVPVWGHSVGSGEQAAHGSLFTTKDLDMTTEQRIEVALEAAVAVVPSVRGPFVTLKL